ncbi:alpha/beta fold hydrolase [Amycolatopsis sp. H20-H5]|uniref:alpha/beta fold hydrolase n=1 Tax=Amycolatopsis sp. H20-H5 TaxID=3046309 RepID=UPI002DB9F315|nr:alpha/beta hydrolase [Amycolatopsis sp. H20-H5]MEC3979028.1 alpha/beta hydrolase [Amycolatopsis sp. H20-H5]
MTRVVLISGGLWEDVGTEQFWRRPGIVAGLLAAGFEVVTPPRPDRPLSWSQEVEYVGRALTADPVTIIAGSNGCSVAAGLASAYPDRVAKLLLAWPATAGDPGVDERARSRLLRQEASPDVVCALLAGDTLRGHTDRQLSTLRMEVGVLPSIPDNPAHQRRTVDALLRVLPRVQELPGCPESPRPQFAVHLRSFLGTVVNFVLGGS